jgi:hypothetical protein
MYHIQEQRGFYVSIDTGIYFAYIFVCFVGKWKCKLVEYWFSCRLAIPGFLLDLFFESEDGGYIFFCNGDGFL